MNQRWILLLLSLCKPSIAFLVHKRTTWPSWKPPCAQQKETEEGGSPVLSDEELLLACRAYLQKKNRLGEWTEAEKRKESRKRQQEMAKGSLTGGFFWEDPSELTYFRSNRSFFNGTDQNNHQLEEEEELEDQQQKRDNELAEDQQLQDTAASSTKNTMSASRLEQVAFEFQDDSHHSRLEQWSREFSSFPTEPSETRLKRSRGMLRKWQDPEWKARWYESRWGKHKRQKETTSQEETPLSKRKQQARAAALPIEFLASDEFSGLSEEEISQAVEMYTESNAKRAVNRKQSLKERKQKLNEGTSILEPRVPLNALAWDRDPEALKEAQRKRSERARQAYKQRLKNQAIKSKKDGNNEGDKTVLPKKKPFPGGSTPQDALLRIESDLDDGKVPTTKDLELIVKPRRLAKRKILLKRILLERFGLRGRCVPLPVEGDPDKLEFISNCSVDQLMGFVLATVRKEEDKEKD